MLHGLPNGWSNSPAAEATEVIDAMQFHLFMYVTVARKHELEAGMAEVRRPRRPGSRLTQGGGR